MEFIQYQYDGVSRLGLIKNQHVFSVSNLLERSIPDFNTFITSFQKSDLSLLESSLKDLALAEAPLAETKLLAPIAHPQHDILCVGVNYHDHVKEVAQALGDEVSSDVQRPAVFFSKRSNKILGSNDTLHAAFNLDSELDYEVELAVIIGKGGKNIQASDALEYIFGYSIFNDFSSRQLQRAHQQWFKGKSLDGYTAMGPSIITKDTFDLTKKPTISCQVNNELRQQATLDQMMTTIPEIIAQLSAGMTLMPGDIIATGTPAGVAMGMNPPKFLQAGDRVDCQIQGLGQLTTYIS